MKTTCLFSSGTSTRLLDWASLLLRIIGALALMYGHGWGKLDKVMSGADLEFVNPFGIGSGVTFHIVMFAEFFCAALVLIGLLTRIALIPLLINFLFIAFVIHGSDPFAVKEMGLLYLGIFGTLMLLGPGKHSVDRLINKRVSKV